MILIDKKHIVLLTDSKLLENNILESCNISIGNIINQYPKIDLLISDYPISTIDSYKIKTIINISNNYELSSDEIKLPKPFKLNTLLKLITKSLNDKSIFCAITNDLIYNENTKILSAKNGLIRLTEKENDILKSLLLSPQFTATKESLMKNIWAYHEDTQSLTLESHLYKLKNKLPNGLLEIKNGISRLLNVP